MTHAERELDILEKNVENAIIIPFRKEIEALVSVVMKSGQSGGSMPYTASAVSKAVKTLLMQQNIFPLTGEDWEWNDISDYNDGKPMWQNNRDSRVFKYSDGTCTFNDAIVWDGDIGGTFTGNNSVEFQGKRYGSSQIVKKFPFEPKTFYVKVKDLRWKDERETVRDENGEWWTHEVIDTETLEQALTYYKEQEVK